MSTSTSTSAVPRKWGSVDNESKDHDATNKRAKVPTTMTFINVEWSKMTVGKVQSGTNDRFCSLEYDGKRPLFQLSTLPDLLRSPFKPKGFKDEKSGEFGEMSICIDLDGAVLEKWREFEEVVKDAAVASRDEWYPSKNGKSEDSIRDMFNSSVKVDQSGKWAPHLRVSIDNKHPPTVKTTEMLSNGKMTRPKTGSLDDLCDNAAIVAVIKPRRGVWIGAITGYGVKMILDNVMVVTNRSGGQETVMDMGGMEFVDPEPETQGKKPDDEDKQEVGVTTIGSDEEDHSNC
jgi:hypothetical protein